MRATRSCGSLEMDREASMLRAVRHAHVVQFLGAGTTDQGIPFLLTELMELGSLTHILRSSAASARLSGDGGPGSAGTDGSSNPASGRGSVMELSWVRKRRFAFEVACGMALVHSLGRDLKSGNILVTSIRGQMRLKVADFGTAALASFASASSLDVTDASKVTDLDQRAHTMRTKGVGTPLWMAPELLAGDAYYNQSADVYSFAIVMWEIAAQDADPWPDVHGSFFMERLLQRLRAGDRPRVDPGWPAEYVQVMKECWSGTPSARPTFPQIMLRLQ